MAKRCSRRSRSTLALPGLAYSGLVMSEVAFYPVIVAAVWAAARALESPTRGRQAVLVLAFVLAVATRLQAVVLVPVFATALALESAIARRRIRLSAFAPSFFGAALAGAAWLGWKLVAHESLLGGYRDVAGSYSLGRAARFVGYHATDVALLAGIFPLCALLVLLWSGLRQGEQDARVRAYLAVSRPRSAVCDRGGRLRLAKSGCWRARPVGLAPCSSSRSRSGSTASSGGYRVRVLVARGGGRRAVAPLGTLVTPAALRARSR